MHHSAVKERESGRLEGKEKRKTFPLGKGPRMRRGGPFGRGLLTDSLESAIVRPVKGHLCERALEWLMWALGDVLSFGVVDFCRGVGGERRV